MQHSVRLRSNLDHTDARNAIARARRPHWLELEALADLGLSDIEIAAYFGMDRGDLDRLRKYAHLGAQRRAPATGAPLSG